MKFAFVLPLILFLGCSTTKSEKDEKNDPIPRQPEKEAVKKERLKKEDDSAQVMPNGLDENLKGVWVNTEFTDSIYLEKEILPYKNVFYGNLFFEINENDTAFWGGNMDGGHWHLISTSDSTFKLTSEIGRRLYDIHVQIIY